MNTKKSRGLSHAVYYEQCLRRLNELFDSGGIENATSALKGFDMDWLQIQFAQQHVAANPNNDRLALHLCKIFYDAGTEIFMMRLSSTERIQWLENAKYAAIKLGDRQAESACLGNQAVAYVDTGEYEKGLGNLQKAVQMAEELGGNENLIIIQFHNIANALVYQGRIDEALENFDEALKRVTENRLKATIQLGKGIALLHAEEFKEAQYQINNALSYAQSQDHPILLEKCFNAYGSYYLTLGRFEQAKEAFQNALVIARELGNIKSTSYLYNNISNIYLYNRDYEKVIQLAQEAVKLAIVAKDDEAQAVALTTLAQGHVFLGNYLDASTAFNSSFDVLQFAQLSAIFDEWYAVDVSQRRKADIAHRKSKGITVGRAPFGTKRDKKTGFLIPSDEGAWLLPDGSWVAGVAGEQTPIEGAIWRGYYPCAERMLKLYVDQKRNGRIWQRLQDEGWAFRDGQGQPRPIEKEDVRRAVSNWAEYGGHVSASKARDRHPSEYPPDEIIAKLKPDRAVFPVELLARVARARQKRALGKHPSIGVNRKARAYPLAGITYCARCEALAKEISNPKLRSLLSGHIGTYYRHKPGGSCGCTTKSVRREVFEAQFFRLIQALEVKPESVALLNQLALKLNTSSDENPENLEQQKAEAIALCNRKIQAAIELYGDGRLSREEYLRRVELNEREIASWQARTTETEKLSVELGMCIQAVEMTKKLWEVGDNEDKQGMVRHLFDYIVFDLDKQCIVDFRLKAWADQFVISRVALHLEENDELSNDENPIVLTGFEPVFWP